MTYAVSNRINAGTRKTEYIVVNSSGVMAPPPYGGPFLSKAEAEASCAALLKIISIEEWLAARIESKIVEQANGSGKVMYIAPDGRWIQNRGRNTFAVYPPTDLDLEVGEMVNVVDGKIERLDHSHSRPPGMRR